MKSFMHGGVKMGFFGGDNDRSNQPSESERLAAQQIQENRAELETKKRSLYQTRLDIIKGQGAPIWTPNRTAPVHQ